jgi:PAS domain S-box-containing protein
LNYCEVGKILEIPSTMRKDEWNQLLEIILRARSIMVTDSSGIIIWVNDSFSQLTGYTPEEAIGRRSNLLNSGRQDSKYYQRLWKTITKGDVWEGILINKRKDGSLYQELMRIEPIRSGSGTITHFVALKSKVDSLSRETEIDSKGNAVLESVLPLMTELKNVTASLEQARSEMHAMLNATSEAMMLLSPSGNMMWLNRAFERFFALDTSEVSGSLFHSLKSHWDKVFEDSNRFNHVIKLMDEKSDAAGRETVFQIWPQKREIEIYSAPVVNANQENLGHLFVFRDVTREREVERLKSEFVSLVSHEFRTPLTSIRGYTEMMLDGDIGELSNEERDFLNTILRNATHLTEIVNDLLVVSRLEAGAIKLNLTSVDMSELIKEAIDLLRPQFNDKKQKIKTDISQGLPILEADSQRINQILVNLLSNAHKYTPEGGSISVSLHHDSNWVRVDVRDSGIGLSKEEKEKLFTKFYRAENPETTKAGGTGLGLWITRSLVNMHGGEISVTSQPGKGSTFIFTLPIRKG